MTPTQIIVKAVSAGTFVFGVRTATLTANQVYTIANEDPFINPQIYQSVFDYVSKGLLTIVSGPWANVFTASVDQPASATIAITGTVSTNDTVTIGTQTFQFAVGPAGAVLGSYNTNLTNTAYVWAGAGSATEATAAGTLVTAINNFQGGNALFPATALPVVTVGSGSYIGLSATNDVITGTGIALAKSSSGITVSAATFTTGLQGGALLEANWSYTATAADVTSGAIWANLGFPNAVTRFVVQLITATTGAMKAWSGDVVINTSGLMLVNTGGTNFAAGDIFTIYANGH